MSFVSFLKNSFWLQDLAARLICKVPPPVHHNLDKLRTIRKAFAITSLEGVGGDYVEFGVFEGNSLVAAVTSYEGQDLAAYVDRDARPSHPCRFFGFDSFEGFKPDPNVDPTHAVFSKDNFSTSFQKVERRLHRHATTHQVHLIKGFFSDTCTREHLATLKINSIRICLIDCDLGSSTRDALQYSPALWQPGTVVILDDYFSYPSGGGEFTAFQALCESHPEFRYRDFGHYGFGGRVFMVESPPRYA